ncbi:hypothetical protein O7635_27845 [Asanoa sp. WMMD1127]|uniref:hypothetical protein n=1 Tax=Asanoa sp. WMMD1127 TaxID=3016107 RepID=UPI00241794C9|nr:hypothetical protein [Asanoa sp. WMMD1127]MDG4825676.1 hypothetical protein [Asanoa sp. WMMD1127]
MSDAANFVPTEDEMQQRLRAAVAKTLRHRADRRRQRADFASARAVGLTRRHADKLARRQP